VLGPLAKSSALKQFRLLDFELPWDGDAVGLAAALAQLPAGLEYLDISYRHSRQARVPLPTGIVHHLQQLTFLNLTGAFVLGPDKTSPALQPLRCLTQLVDLRLCLMEADGNRITANMLSGTHQLTMVWHT
jgi:hypothetical protein